MLYITDRFSEDFLPKGEKVGIVVIPITVDQARRAVRRVEYYSLVNSVPLAAILWGLLRTEIRYSKAKIVLNPDHEGMILARYSGPQLQEGVIELPPGGELALSYIRAVTPEQVNGLCDFCFLLPWYFRE